MMGVYISGIDMPKDDCAVYKRVVISDYFIDGEMKILAHDDITGVFIGEVIDVPEPHGRLIDADALKRKSQKVATEAWKLKIKATVEVILNQFIDYIDAAPTVIEGSE